jgi:hypothetical protein
MDRPEFFKQAIAPSAPSGSTKRLCSGALNPASSGSPVAIEAVPLPEEASEKVFYFKYLDSGQASQGISPIA